MQTPVMKRKLSEFIPKPFHPVWKAAMDPHILNIVCKGGRGSGKFSDIAHINKAFIAAVMGVRKLRVYQLIKDCVQLLIVTLTLMQSSFFMN